MKKSLIKKYARVIANKGIGLRKGQQVVVNAPVSAYSFVELLVEELYKCEASRVEVQWSDAAIMKAKYKYESEETLKELPKHVKEKAKYTYKNRIARISISSADPDGMKGIDFNKLKISRKASAPLNKYLSDPYMASLVQWCVAAIPNPKWAKKVFYAITRKTRK